MPPENPAYVDLADKIRSQLRAGDTPRSVAIEFLGMADKVSDLWGLAPRDPKRRQFRAMVGDLVRAVAAEVPRLRVVGLTD